MLRVLSLDQASSDQPGRIGEGWTSLGTEKSPIGVLIGTLLKELLISKKRTDIVLGKSISVTFVAIYKIILGSLSCVAAGTFIFLVFMELIPENIKINKPGKKIIAVFVGFFVISIVEIFIWSFEIWPPLTLFTIIFVDPSWPNSKSRFLDATVYLFLPFWLQTDK